ncbi:uncharacterized protein PV06_04319 [Exophiala oligosperma]|uniref:Uncharacterized protein n=2 Tax=Chaetothyriales TaxID=34395 RepID=A0A0D2ATJ8_9EURO|nr:uncharacterized protein PV06_04319 [Exophiala oligosperma]KAJ9636204.1 hypothetical protein H2204_005476 [Knufia peltigerae]KIW43186.1 hypothetical protein PV06_04319 [Exophiala oligosperma]
MSHFTLTTFLATTATALAPFVIVYNMPQTTNKTHQLTTSSSLPKPRPLATLREVKEQQGKTEFNLI